MSTSDPYWRAKDIFAEAIDLPRRDRADFLAGRCAGDAALLSELEVLMATHDRAVDVAVDAADDDRQRASVGAGEFGYELPGTLIGPYEILERIGEGGMGVVYKAQQRAPIQRIVALKLIKLGMDTREVIARFEGERQSLAVLQHPNIAKVYDAGATAAGRPYFAMEYIDGLPITTYCDRHQLTTKKRLELFIQVCEAVGHAHQKALIHRDLKPGNILVADEGGRLAVKLIDFGVAKATEASRSQETFFGRTGHLVGTPEYMSPEQADASAVDIDTRTDIYSLGVVLYELVVGALPFDVESLRGAAYERIREVIRDSSPPTPSARLETMAGALAAEIASRRSTRRDALQGELRSELEWIPMKAMRKERSGRYATAGEFARDLVAYLEQKPLIAAPDSRTYKLRKLVQRHRGPFAAAATVLIVLLAGIVGTTIGLVGQSRQRAIAERERREADVQRREADVQRLSAESRLAWMLRASRQFDPAESMMREVLAARRKTLLPTDVNLSRTVSDLAYLLQERKEYDEAERLYREALGIDRNAVPPAPEHLAETLTRLALMNRVMRRYAEAVVLLREADGLYRQVAPDSVESGEATYYVAYTLADLGQFDESERLYAQAIGEYERANLPESWHLGNAHLGLGRELDLAQKVEQAEKELIVAERLLAAYPELHEWSALALVEHFTSRERTQPGNGYAEQAKYWHDRLLPDFIEHARAATRPTP